MDAALLGQFHELKDDKHGTGNITSTETTNDVLTVPSVSSDVPSPDSPKGLLLLWTHKH